MNIAIEIESRNESNPVGKVLKLVISTLTNCKITDVGEADLVITNHHEQLLRFLKQGKRVFQFITMYESPAEGLLTAPAFADRFRIFMAVEGMKGLAFPGFVPMLAEIENVRKEIERENPRS